MKTDLLYGTAARSKMYLGVCKLADAVKTTLGPKGRNVAIRQPNEPDAPPLLTKDGAMVARTINLIDPYEDMGAQAVKEAALKTMVAAGDGTTTATILAQEIISAGIDRLNEGSNPMDLKRGIDMAVACVVDCLRKQSIRVSADSPEIRSIASISANNEFGLGGIIADARAKLGENGHIWLQQSMDERTWIDVIDGLHFENGYTSHHFINTPETASVEFANAYILIYDKKISQLADIQVVLDIALTDKRPLLIVAEDIDGDALKTMVINKLGANTPFAAVKTPGAGINQKEFLEDFAAITGGQLICEDQGTKLVNVTRKQLGQASSISITKSTTIIRGGKGLKPAIEARIVQIKAMIGDTKYEVERERQKLRLARVTNGIAVMYVGAPSDVEAKEKKMRADDALRATKAAIEEGIVPGGGVAYIQCLETISHLKGKNQDENIGVAIIRNAILCPLRQMLRNAGEDENAIVDHIIDSKTPNYGFNVKSGEYENMVESGVIDPTKVAICALEYSASVAAMFLTTECAIINAQ